MSQRCLSVKVYVQLVPVELVGDQEEWCLNELKAVLGKDAVVQPSEAIYVFAFFTDRGRGFYIEVLYSQFHLITEAL
jgi:hypothetical protein